MIERTACLLLSGKDPFSYQAVEKHLMEALPDGTALLLMGETATAVMAGRKQDIEKLCRREQLSEIGGVLSRRISGGEAWYLSPGILCFSLIVPKADFSIPKQTTMLCSACMAAGIPMAYPSGTTLQVSGHPFCRCAYYKIGNIGLHHGTILCDADVGHIALCLTDKNASDAISLSSIGKSTDIADMESALAQALGEAYGSEPVWLDEQLLDKAAVERYREDFRKSSWINGEALPADEKIRSIHISESFPWGSVAVSLAEEGGIIRAAIIHTDAMESLWFELLERSLVSCPYLISAITARFGQAESSVRNPHLMQIANDLCRLICGHIRISDRKGEENA